MNQIEKTFRELKGRDRAALIPFLVAGDPGLETTEAMVIKMAESGADIIELGVPHSDPLADGPTIQAASRRALLNGVSLGAIFRLAERLKGISTALVLMTYFNPVFRYGLNAFAADCQRCGIAGAIIPDLPPEEAGPWIVEARKRDLATIFLAAPTSPPKRIRRISRCCHGFIYYVSLTGVTGVRRELAEELEPSVLRIRGETQKPIAVGFGISTQEQVKEVSRFADGVIIGSAIVKIIEEDAGKEEMIQRVGGFISTLATGCYRDGP